MNQNSFIVNYKFLCLGFIAWAFVLFGYSACPTSKQIWDELLLIEQSDLPAKEKLQKVLLLERQSVQCKLPKDSVYARVLHRLGVLSFISNDMNSAINYTLQSTKINRTGEKNTSQAFVANSYDNLGLYYKNLLFYREALMYFDSSVYFGSRHTGQERFVLQSKLMRSNIFFRTGDYQKSIDEATQGLFTARTVNDSFKIAQFLNERAQAMISIGVYAGAATDLNEAVGILSAIPDVQDVLADSYRLLGTLYEFTNDTQQAFSFYTKAIEQRKIVNSLPDLAKDLMETGNFLSLKMNATEKAMTYYRQALQLSTQEQDITVQAQVLNNMGVLLKDKKKDYQTALTYFQQGMRMYVPGFRDTSNMANPSQQQLQKIADKQLLFILLDNKAEVLLLLFRQTKNKLSLQKANETFILADRVIDEMRYSQNTEPTKLYWRTKTRNFYTRAVVAAVESNNADAALFFMEKSRSVLLNDKLNELGAFAYLPPTEAAKEQQLRIDILLCNYN
jgi:tetratricopeptide (TPR) repeat protein